MFSVLSTVFFWGKDNFKWIAIIVIGIVLAFGAWRYTKLVSDYAKAQNVIEQLEQSLEDTQRLLKFEQDLNKLGDEALQKVDQEKQQLEQALEDLTKNLPDDVDNLAPESLRETLRRLKALEQ